MPGTFLSAYLAFLLQTGPVPAAPVAPIAEAVVAKPAPAKPALVLELESRDRAPAIAPSLSLGGTIALADVAATKGATSAEASAIVDKVQQFYADIQQVKAKFRQVVTNKTFGRESKPQDGIVEIKKPGKMRWDYYSPKTKSKAAQVTKSFISDGSYLYVVDRANKQVIEKNLEKDMLPVAVTFLYGKGDLKKDFDAAISTTKKYGGKDSIVLELTPKVPSAQYKTLYLVVAKDNHRVKESIIVDSAGNVNHFRFFEPNFDAKIDDKRFQFDKKTVKDYRIVTDDDAATK